MATATVLMGRPLSREPHVSLPNWAGLGGGGGGGNVLQGPANQGAGRFVSKVSPPPTAMILSVCLSVCLIMVIIMIILVGLKVCVGGWKGSSMKPNPVCVGPTFQKCNARCKIEPAARTGRWMDREGDDEQN
jgi:hypothetical protein